MPFNGHGSEWPLAVHILADEDTLPLQVQVEQLHLSSQGGQATAVQQYGGCILVQPEPDFLSESATGLSPSINICWK